MEPWSVTKSPNGEMFLRNRSRTLVRVSQRVDPDIDRLMSEMDELKVPFQYADKVKEIYFTLLPSEQSIVVHGKHIDGNIKLNCAEAAQEIMARTLVHELAHALDDHEAISERDDIKLEKKVRARYLPDAYARTSVIEYVAVGFETYYCGTPLEKRRMRRMNPRLYGTIRYLHRKYRSK